MLKIAKPTSDNTKWEFVYEAALQYLNLQNYVSLLEDILMEPFS